MKRRNFLKIAGLTGFAVNGHAMRPFANSKIARVLSSCEEVEDRILVLIQLKGGNDGINTMIPLDQYDRYATLRPAIALPQNSLLTLDGTQSSNKQLGLHPSMELFKSLYEKGWASVVQGVGYTSMNQSHFKSTDLWFSGGDGTPANSNIGSGWMGRSLQAFYPDIVGAPTTDMPDPLGIQIGDASPNLGFHTETQHQNVINLSGQDVSGFYSLVQTIGGAPIINVPDTDQGEELAYIMGVENSTNLYAERISQLFNTGSNFLSEYPTTNDRSKLADQLKTIARLVSAGCKTKIYLCQLGGFDTHSSQVDGGSPSVGTHAELLLELAESVKYFHDDLEGLGLADKILTCTFSEFGRCAAGNASDGTDHGTLAPMMLFGKNVQPGVNGVNVNLSNLNNDNQLQGMQYDYRQVFATILQDWLGANENVMTEAMFSGYQKLPLLDGAAIASPDCYWPSAVGIWEHNLAVKPLQINPNPATYFAEVTFENAGGPFEGRLSVHSLGGSLLNSNLVTVQQGGNVFFLDAARLPSGTYFIRLENRNNGRAEVAKLTVVK